MSYVWGGGEHEMRSGGCGPVSGSSWARIRTPRADLLRNAMVKSSMHRFWADFGSRGRQIVGVIKTVKKYQWPISDPPFLTRLEKLPPKMMLPARHIRTFQFSFKIITIYSKS